MQCLAQVRPHPGDDDECVASVKLLLRFFADFLVDREDARAESVRVRYALVAPVGLGLLTTVLLHSRMIRLSLDVLTVEEVAVDVIS